MGGGQGGLRGFIKHFGWSGPEQLEQVAVDEIDGLYGDFTMDEIEAWRDANLLAIEGQVRHEPEK